MKATRSNPQFATGDARDWAPVAGPTLANQSVVPRATAGVPANAPTANVMRYNFGVGAVTTISTGAGAIVYNQPNAVDCAIPVIAGQSYRFTIDAAKSATGTLTSFLVGMTQLTSAGLFTNFAVEFVASVSTTFSTLTGIYVAPVGVVAVWPYVIGSMTGTGEVYWTNLTDRTMTSSSLVDVPSFSTAGLALFGGALQSTNFTAGVNGWRITNAGAAEFNSLVVREDMVQAGAIGRKAFSYRSSIEVTATSLATATLIGQILPFTVAPYVSVGGAVINPCQVMITCVLRDFFSPGGRSIIFSLQRRLVAGPGAWSTSFSKTFLSPNEALVFRTADLGAAFMNANTFDASGLYEYQIVAHLSTTGTGTLVVLDFFCTFEQLNRV